MAFDVSELLNPCKQAYNNKIKFPKKHTTLAWEQWKVYW